MLKGIEIQRVFDDLELSKRGKTIIVLFYMCCC